MTQTSIMFLCTGNSCRSQMAEGWLRKLHPEFASYSAGIVAHGKNPLAIKAMSLAGVDISGQESQSLDDLPHSDFDYVVTVCGHADESCPMLAAKTKRIHAPFDDPPKLAKDAESEEEALVHYCRVRDDIKKFVTDIKQHLGIS